MSLDPQLGTGVLALAALMLLIGGFARGYSGFGFTALLMPVLSFVLPTAEIVPVALALETLASLWQAHGVRAVADWRQVWLLTLGSIPGIPIGAAALAFVDPTTMRIVALALVLLASLLLLGGWRVAAVRGQQAAILVPAGLLTGLVTGAAGIGGLFLVIFLTALAIAPERLRGTIIVYFLVLDLITVAVFGAMGLFGRIEIVRTLWALPVTVLGVWLGGRHFLAASPQTFRRYTLVALVAISLIGLASALGGVLVTN